MKKLNGIYHGKKMLARARWLEKHRSEWNKGVHELFHMMVKEGLYKASSVWDSTHAVHTMMDHIRYGRYGDKLKEKE